MDKNMKNTTKIALATAVVAISFAVTAQIKADDSLLPPRAQALKPKMITQATQAVQTSKAGTSATDPNLLGHPVYTGKTFRDTRPQFEVAPLK